MRTLHSVLKHGGLYWDANVLPPPAYEERFSRIQAAVAESGDDAWIVIGDVMRYGDVTYITNFMPRVRSAIAFVPREGDPMLIANIGLRDVPAAKTLTWVEEVQPFGKVSKGVVDLVRDKGLEKARIGTCGFGHALFEADWAEIDAELPGVTWQPRDTVMSGLRAAKEGWEMAAVRRNARIAGDALLAAPDALKPGVTVREALAAVDLEARAQGAEDVRFMVASGPQVAGALRPVDDRRLEQGDVLMLYMAVQAQRYWAETARTFVLGPAGEELKSLYRQAEETLAAMRDAAVAGCGAADIAAAAAGTVADKAMAAKAAAYGWGNGIGLDAEEAPLLAAGTGAKIADGATLALRAVMHGKAAGAIAAQTVIVRADGVEEISTPAEPVEIGG